VPRSSTSTCAWATMRGVNTAQWAPRQPVIGHAPHPACRRHHGCFPWPVQAPARGRQIHRSAAGPVATAWSSGGHCRPPACDCYHAQRRPISRPGRSTLNSWIHSPASPQRAYPRPAWVVTVINAVPHARAAAKPARQRGKLSPGARTQPRGPGRRPLILAAQPACSQSGRSGRKRSRLSRAPARSHARCPDRQTKRAAVPAAMPHIDYAALLAEIEQATPDLTPVTKECAPAAAGIASHGARGGRSWWWGVGGGWFATARGTHVSLAPACGDALGGTRPPPRPTAAPQPRAGRGVPGRHREDPQEAAAGGGPARAPPQGHRGAPDQGGGGRGCRCVGAGQTRAARPPALCFAAVSRPPPAPPTRLP